MKTLVTAVALSLCMSGMAFATTAQQQKMADCNKQAAGQTGAARKAAMKACLSSATPAAPAAAATPAAPAAPAAMSTQQNKMADCNKQATGKTGADRKAFMSSCLSGKPMPTAPAAAPSMPAAAPAAAPATGAVDKNGKPLTAQQSKMADCAHQGKGKKGADYKAFMSQCLKK